MRNGERGVKEILEKNRQDEGTGGDEAAEE